MAPSDPRYLDMTHDEMLVDLYAWMHHEDPRLRNDMVTEDFDAELAAMEAQATAADDGDWETITDGLQPGELAE